MRSSQVNKLTVGWEVETTQAGDMPDSERHVLAAVPHLKAGSCKNGLAQQMSGDHLDKWQVYRFLFVTWSGSLASDCHPAGRLLESAVLTRILSAPTEIFSFYPPSVRLQPANFSAILCMTFLCWVTLRSKFWDSDVRPFCSHRLTMCSSTYLSAILPPNSNAINFVSFVPSSRSS